MDELLQSLIVVRSALLEFADRVCIVKASLGEEYEHLPKRLIPAVDRPAIEDDIAFLSSFSDITAVQLEEYLDGKIDILKAFLYEE